jgi:hypothetical protein
MGGHIPMILGCLVEGAAKGRFRSDLSPVLGLGAVFSLAVLPQIVRRLVSASGIPALQTLPNTSQVADVMSDILLRGIGGDNIS